MSDPTTTNIPTTDPALLAAQSKAGQAGVDAYNAAISTLQQQRQAAVSSAMTSAAARGLAEPGAGQDVGRMYDSRISQLQAGMGQFQADTAARGQRLSDYNAAVNSARNLIPGQVSIATAPIKAQGEFDVWKIGAEGRQKVDQINAQKELVGAQMEAAKLAAAHSGGGGGGGGRGGGVAVRSCRARRCSRRSSRAPPKDCRSRAPRRSRRPRRRRPRRHRRRPRERWQQWLPGQVVRAGRQPVVEDRAEPFQAGRGCR
jgi:hypothetical protein